MGRHGMSPAVEHTQESPKKEVLQARTKLARRSFPGGHHHILNSSLIAEKEPGRKQVQNVNGQVYTSIHPRELLPPAPPRQGVWVPPVLMPQTGLIQRQICGTAPPRTESQEEWPALGPNARSDLPMRNPTASDCFTGYALHPAGTPSPELVHFVNHIVRQQLETMQHQREYVLGQLQLKGQC